jgi:hypothetical protein
LRLCNSKSVSSGDNRSIYCKSSSICTIELTTKYLSAAFGGPIKIYVTDITEGMIPKICHMYWDGSPFSLLNFISVKSFRKHHPDWEMRMWSPIIKTLKTTWTTTEQQIKYIGTDYFDQLNSLGVTNHIVDFDKIGFINGASEVIKSDYFRYWVLVTHGGAWSDCDIVFIRPISFAEQIDTVICCNNVNRNIFFPVGFLMASPNNALFTHLLSLCKKRYDPLFYQCLGTLLFQSVFPTLNSVKAKYPALNIVVMDKWSYLPIDWNQCDFIFHKEAPKDTIRPQTFGIHWFNGGAIAKNYQNAMSAGKASQSGTLYKYIKEYL